jgi:hypothetical protein
MSVMGLFIFGAVVQILIGILDPASADSLIYVADANFLFIVQYLGWLVFGIGAGAILYDLLTSGKKMTY